MRNIHLLLKKAFTSVTIMVIPHDGLRELNLKVPMAGLIVSICLAAIGGAYVFGLALNGLKLQAQHHAMAEKVKFYSEQFYQWNSTVASLKNAEKKFRQLFSLGSKEQVLDTVEASFVGSIGSIEIVDLISNLKKTIGSVDEIKNYLSVQKDVHVATPKGYPVPGRVTSPFGNRADPISGVVAFHSGVDISNSSGSPIRCTADGVVSHSGWTNTSGFVVVLEHGCGFTTVYAHNQKNAVKLGQRVKRGDIIGYIGSTGKSTGPHVHYEVWKDGKTVNAQQYLQRSS
jgi:murein DD-endopeptidase MepM/ murein hydrolase activator NlpD